MPQKLEAGSAFPKLTWPTVGGGPLDLERECGWRALIVYRGRHCPLCKRYLNQLNELLEDFREAGIFIAAISSDPAERAEASASEGGWSFPLAYGLSEDEMRELGLYVSDPRSPEETDRRFAEPALFVINPKNELQIIDVSNAPFARPDLDTLLGGLKFVIANDYPIRGTA